MSRKSVEKPRALPGIGNRKLKSATWRGGHGLMPKKHSDDCGCHPNRRLSKALAEREGFWCGCSDRTGGFGIHNAFPDLGTVTLLLTFPWDRISA